MSNTPKIKPDWKNISDYSVDLSGRKINYSLPGKLSGDFLHVRGENTNIYDESLFGDMRLFTVSEFHWDYKSKHLFFYDTIGTLSFRLAVYKTDSDFKGDIHQDSIFEKVLRSRLKPMEPDIENILDKNITEYSVGDNRWFSYKVSKRPGSSEKFIYLLPISDDRYIQVLFQILVGDDEDRDGWYKTCLADIEKIIQSFKVVMPE